MAKQKNGNAYLRRQEALLKRSRLSAFFPPMAEDEETNIIIYDDGYIGKVYLCSPLVGCDDSDVKQLQSTLSNEFPTDTLISFHQISSSYIDQFLGVYLKRRSELLSADNGLGQNQRVTLNELIKSRVALFEKSKKVSMTPSTGVISKNNFLMVSVKIPASAKDGDEKIMTVNSHCESVKETLDLIGMQPKAVDRKEYAYFIRGILKMGQDASAKYKENLSIAQQMTDFETTASLEKEYIQVNDSYIKSMSILDLPEQTNLAVMDKLIGDSMGSNNQMIDPFMLTTTIYYKNAEKVTKSFAKAEQNINYQFNGKIGQMIRSLQSKYQGFALYRDSIDAGFRPVQISVNLCVISDSKEKLEKSASKARSFYETHGFTMQEDTDLHFPAFISNLPGFCNNQYIKMSNRFWTLTTQFAPHFLPLLGEWRGTGDNANNIFISRRGQVMLCDFIDTDSNKNGVICAASGMGKSFFANDIVVGALSKGAQIRIIDQGKSYEKLSSALHGQFIEFGDSSKIILNPFTNIQDIDEEIEALTMLVGKMACPTTGLDDWQYNAVSRCIKEVWHKTGSKSTMTHLQEILGRKGRDADNENDGRIDQRYLDLADQLSEFCRHGAYESYFEGASNLDWNNNLVILELDELKSKKRLESVVLMMLIIQIQRECYSDQSRGVQKIFMIDEAWALFKDPELARFIEDAYRRFRKYSASCIVITQSLYDLYSSPVGGPIIENTNSIMLLGQEEGTVQKLKREKRLGDNSYLYTLLESVHTKDGKYSEIMFKTGRGVGIVRYVVDRFTQLLYTTKGEEVAAIKELEKSGLSVIEAIKEYMRYEGTLKDEEEINLERAA